MRMSELINLWSNQHKQNKHIYFYRDPLNMIVFMLLHRYPFYSKKRKLHFILHFFSPLNERQFCSITWKWNNSPRQKGSASSTMIYLFSFLWSKKWMTASPSVMEMFSIQITLDKISSFLPIFIFSSTLKIV